MKFAIFELSASVDIRPLVGAWVAEIVLGVQDHKYTFFNKKLRIWMNYVS